MKKNRYVFKTSRTSQWLGTLFVVFTISLVCAVAFFTSGCKSTEESPAEKPKVEAPAAGPAETADLAWGRTPAARIGWSNLVLDKVADSKMPDQEYTDIDSICPKYAKLTRNQKVEVISQFISRIAQAENSKFNPKTEYKENFKSSATGDYVISTGLFQISKSSSNQSRYACNTKTQEQLHDPLFNIECSIKILDYWLVSSKHLMGTSSKNVGCGAYWSVCRPSSSKYSQIKTYMKNLEVCK